MGRKGSGHVVSRAVASISVRATSQIIATRWLSFHGYLQGKWEPKAWVLFLYCQRGPTEDPGVQYSGQWSPRPLFLMTLTFYVLVRGLWHARSLVETAANPYAGEHCKGSTVRSEPLDVDFPYLILYLLPGIALRAPLSHSKVSLLQWSTPSRKIKRNSTCFLSEKQWKYSFVTGGAILFFNTCIQME